MISYLPTPEGKQQSSGCSKDISSLSHEWWDMQIGMALKECEEKIPDFNTLSEEEKRKIATETATQNIEKWKGIINPYAIPRCWS